MDSRKLFQRTLLCIIFVGFQRIHAQETGFTYNVSAASSTMQTEFGTHNASAASPTMAMDFGTHSASAASPTTPTGFQTHNASVASPTTPTEFETHNSSLASSATQTEFGTHNSSLASSTMPTESGTHNASAVSPTMQTEVVTINQSKVVEKCDKNICVDDICRVNGSVSRPTFYARCPDVVEGEEDVSFYCMCATAYHVLASKETEPSYVQITPDINCREPETIEDQQLCQQSKCEGLNTRQTKAVHICESDGKYYCACFN